MNGMDWITFFSRNGYGGYIWGSIGMCALVVLGECWALRRRRLQLRQEITQEPVQEPTQDPTQEPMLDSPTTGVNA